MTSIIGVAFQQSGERASGILMSKNITDTVFDVVYDSPYINLNQVYHETNKRLLMSDNPREVPKKTIASTLNRLCKRRVFKLARYSVKRIDKNVKRYIYYVAGPIPT
jgi:regulatory protein YycI of two-component signal transduction system YycFG